MLGSLNTGGAGADTLEVINRTGNAINSGDKVWINKSVTSEGSIVTNTGGQSIGCIISPDGSKVYCTQYEGSGSRRPYKIYDITNLSSLQTFYSGSFGSGFNNSGMVLGYTDAGNVTITWITYSSGDNNLNLLMLKRNGNFVRTKIGSAARNQALYLGGNYWASQTSNSIQLIQYNEDTDIQAQIAASSSSVERESILRGCYNPSTGVILATTFPYRVSGASISVWYSASSVYSAAPYSGGFANQGSLYIGNQSQNAETGSTTNGEFRVATWSGGNTQTKIKLNSIGLGDLEGKSVWPLYNQYTKILTVASCFGTDYKVYRYDESNNYFNEVVVQLNTEGNKFVGPISFSEDLKKCAYTCIPSTESAISNNYANVKHMVEEIGASAKTIAIPYNFSNNYASTLTGVAETSGNNEETLMVRTVLPPKISVNVLADVNNMELVVR